MRVKKPGVNAKFAQLGVDVLVRKAHSFPIATPAQGDDEMQDYTTPTITKAHAQQIVKFGMSCSADGLQAAALFWMLAEEKAGRVARFRCEMSDTLRFAAA